MNLTWSQKTFPARATPAWIPVCGVLILAHGRGEKVGGDRIISPFSLIMVFPESPSPTV